MRKTADLDAVDRQIVHALQLDPRAAFSQVAHAVGVAEQTVARRYGRLRRAGLVRVIGSVDATALGETDWLIRVRCRPDGALQVAEALARRADAAWVSIAGGGSEVLFSLHPRTQQDRDDLLVRRLQRSAPVLDIVAAMILHRFVGADALDWRGRREIHSAAELPEYDSGVQLEAGDQALLALLARDGRTSYTVLARSTGMSIGRVIRRIAALQAGGILYFDLDIAPAAQGSGIGAYLCLNVGPARLESVGRALAGHAETTYIAAVTGPFNLFAAIFCDDADHLYRYVHTKMAALDGIHSFELSPVLRWLKQAGARTDGDLFVDPAAAPPRRKR